MDKDEELVLNFFKSKQIDARQFPKRQTKKNPDFELYYRKQPLGYCEVKSIIDYQALGLSGDPTYNKIQNKIHESSKQFKIANPTHSTPNILFFINHCDKIAYQDLWLVLTGQPTPPNLPSETIDLRYLKRLIKRNSTDQLDLIIWSNIDEEITSFIINSDSKFPEKLKKHISAKAFERKNIKKYT